MNFTPQHHELALTFLAGIGSRRARILIAHFSNLEEFFTEKKLNLSKIPGVPADFVRQKHRFAALAEADKVLERCNKLNIATTFLTDKNYPQRLKTCDDAPLLLYSKGNVSSNAGKLVAIVGTRHATDYGKQLTEKFVSELSESGATIVSGMAYGIDICAHQQAIKNSLPTIGVLGHGLDQLYPAIHGNVAAAMLETGGLISEFPPGLKPEPGFFPMRNRIVAGMTDATLVVESGNKGGSLITAQLANDYNRDVFAFPGDVTRPFSEGCLQLISGNKAHLLIKPADFLRMMNWNKTEEKKDIQRSIFVELDETEQKIVSVIREKKNAAQDVIGYLLTLTPGEISTRLLDLEFKGVVRSLPGKRFTLV